MNKYESIIILKPDLNEEKRKETIEKVTNMMLSFSKKNEAKLEINELGKRNLAYPIRNYLQGEYIQHYFYATADDRIKLEKIYKETNEIIKYIVIKNERKEN